MVDSNTLSELSELSKELNERSDTLNDLIAGLNNQLASFNPGLEFWLDHPLLDSGIRCAGRRVLVYLGYAKVDEHWQLALRQDELDYEWDRDEPVEDPVPMRLERPTSLLKSSRDIRLLAVEKFDDLLHGLKQTVKVKLDAIKRAETFARPK